jgi:hypothetical protein
MQLVECALAESVWEHEKATFSRDYSFSGIPGFEKSPLLQAEIDKNG